MAIQKDLPSYSMFVNPNDLKELRNDIWCEDPVKAKLKMDGKQHTVKLLYRGSHIRKFKKKSYQIVFSQVFDGVKELHFNAEYMDKSLMRNKLSLDFFSSIGTLSPASRHIELNVNGKHQGVYLQLESVDKYFLKRRHLPAGQIFYAEDDDANFSLISPFDDEAKEGFDAGYSMKVGDGEGTEYLSDFIYRINTIPRAEFGDKITKHISVDKYLCWLAGVVCTQNYDGFIHNYALYRNRSTGLFEVIPWDYDATWGRDINGHKMDYDYVPISGYNTLTARILDVPAFRRQYKQLMKAILGHQFTPEYMEPEITAMHSLLRPHLAKDPYISNELEKFDREPEVIMAHIKNRNRYLSSHLRDLD